MKSTNGSRFFLVLLVIWLLLIGSVGSATAQGGDDGFPEFISVSEYKPGEILVKFDAGYAINAATNIMSAYRASQIDTIYGSQVQVWQVPEGNELEIAAQLSREAGIAFAEPNYLYSVFTTSPDDPSYLNGSQWAHQNIHSAAAWDLSTGSNTITIAIVDSGIDEGHPDLAGKIVPGYDFVDKDPDPHDENGHGTHVAGIAAAITNNETGVAGMSWGARIMPIRTMGANGTGYNSDITAGINWAYQNGAKIINLSLGGPDYSQAMQDAINAAHAAGTLVVAAMGNCRMGGSDCPGVNPVMYPAANNNVFAVSSVTRTDTYAYYSQFGAQVDIAAPGGQMSNYHDANGIYSTMPTYPVYLTSKYSYSRNYDYLHGTSQATPYVAGLAALVWSANLALTPDEVQNAIQSNADDIGDPGWDQNYGYGRINAWATLAAVGLPAAPTLEAISNVDGDGNYLVNWDDVPNTTSYQLREDDNAGFATPTTIYSGVPSQYSVTGQGSGIWYYQVKATNNAGESDWSNIQTVSVKPEAPIMDPIVNPGETDAYTLTWSISTGADGYLLQQSPDITFTLPVTRYLGTYTRYRVTGQDGGDWYYRVLAYNVAGNSLWSTQVQSTTVTTPALQAPLLAPIVNPTQANHYALQWTDVPSATGYILEESHDPYFSDPVMVYSDTITQTLLIDQPGGVWYYRVRATSSAGNSPWSNTRETRVQSLVFLPFLGNNFELYGFDSQFNGVSTGWESHAGIWLVDSQYYSTIGLIGTSASASYAGEFANFDLQARILRTGCETCANRLLVRGTPLPLDINYHWAVEYAFNYANQGYFSVGKTVNGVTTVLKGWTETPAINQGGTWNTVRVIAVGNKFSFYINDTLVWSGTDSQIASGRVGLGMYRNLTSIPDIFQVDWVTLTPAYALTLNDLPDLSLDLDQQDQFQFDGNLDYFIP
jgi:subtilisin family serine protease